MVNLSRESGEGNIEADEIENSISGFKPYMMNKNIFYWDKKEYSINFPFL